DATGLLYGATAGGGGPNNSGVIFSIATDGTNYRLLHRFCRLADCSDGSRPNGLILATDGNLYGTTYSGGKLFAGTVFKLSPPGKFRVLYKFNNNLASTPYAGLIQGSDGKFYGTTYIGGPSRAGTVFSITPTGVLTVLAEFTNANGSLPQAPLV